MDELMGQGLSRLEAENYRHGYICKRKPEELPKQSENPLLDLINRYDTSTLEIGFIMLNPANMEHIDTAILDKASRILVGEIEADPLVILSTTGEVQNLDHADLNYVIGTYAISGDCFLDALILLASYQPPYESIPPTVELTEVQKVENNIAAHKHAIECAQAAGIDPSCCNLYEELIGLDWFSE